MVSGAHDLIVQILEPSLQRRATLRDIAAHRWLQDEPPQPSTSLSPCTTPEPTDGCLDIIPSDGDVGLTGSESVYCPESDDARRTALDRCRRKSAPEPFYDSLVVQEPDGRCRSVSSSRSPNLVLVEDGDRSHPDKVCAGDYDDLGRCRRQLSVDVASTEYSHHTGGSFSDDRSPPTLSDLCFQSVSRHRRLSSANSDSLSDVITSDGPSKAVLATAKLPVNFSADSLELLASEDHTDSIESGSLHGSGCGMINLVDAGDSDDDSEADNDNAGDSVRYDFADIDAVLDHISADDVDAGSRVSYDSLEDDV